MEATQTRWQDTPGVSPAFIEEMLAWKQQMDHQLTAWAREMENLRLSLTSPPMTSMPETRSTAPVVSPKAPSKPAQKVAKPTEEAAKPALFQIGLEAINLSFVHFKKLIKIQFLKYGKT